MDPGWWLMILGAMLIGMAKTSFGGLGAVAVALFAFTLPTRESTAAALLLLIVGDVVAVLRYRRNADWGLLRGLLPAVIPGILIGAGFIWAVDDLMLRRAIGVLLMCSVLIQLAITVRSDRKTGGGPARPARALTVAAGVAAGFTTMAANAAGPVMAVYLQLSRVEKLRFLGTSAWFYLIVNLSKTPLTGTLGLFTGQVLRVAALLVPVVLVGAVIGIGLVGRIQQRAFDIFTLLASALAAAALIVR